ncbi:hypothetical protein PsorP6_017243 [Peronosclerospora sorghi]|uniref:Uncharacterized protein n=1 Tax=Peronosclerospora sorghi TaxID=230839 RepID=A0ACC0WL05_9STRA|nr:hypothetical protein PsorP6_017243 [Peronosclerospora sorghi]
MSRASIGDYVVTSKLGSGSFAVVYKGYHKSSKTPVAIKALSLHKLNGKLLANLEMEISIMRQIDHPNIVKLYEIKKTDKHMYLMLEYCAGGDLQQYMRRHEQQGSKSIPEEVARHFLQELARGMQCLWKHNLIHRDLKPQNLLLVTDSPSSALKIGPLSRYIVSLTSVEMDLIAADFGFARHLATTSMAETLCGSPLYMAPEILKFQKYDAKADLWSVGTILFEMVAGRPPYGGANHVQLLANIERQPLRFPLTLQLSSPCRNLLVSLLQRNPALRLGFAEFFSDPFVDLQPLLEELEPAESMRRSTSSLVVASIREDEEESGHPVAGRWGVSIPESRRFGAVGHEKADKTTVAASPASRRESSDKERRSREHLVSNETNSSSRFASTAPSAVLRQSRSGNLEVMETAFASASSGSGALRRSSSLRLARSRRASSSGHGLTSVTSPKLSPQVSPHILPSPSPRINPFKQLPESPPGVVALQQQLSLSGSNRVKISAVTQPSGTNAAITRKQKTGGGGYALDSSGEYVLVDDQLEKPPPGGISSRSEVYRTSEGKAISALRDTALPSACISDAPAESFPPECGLQLIEIVILRTQAISQIADQLWAFSTANETTPNFKTSSPGESTGEECLPQPTTTANVCSFTSGTKPVSGMNFSSVFSMSSSLSSSVGGNHTVGDEERDDEEDEDEDDKRNTERQYVCAAEALALYVKCLRLIRHVVVYLRQDPTFLPCRNSMGSSGSPQASLGWGKTSWKVSIAFLSDQLNHYLRRAEQCKAQMDRASRIDRPVASQHELLYAHALRLGREGAIREVLGHHQAAHDQYLQALLLLESLLVNTPGVNAGALTVDDQKHVNTLLRALELRLKNVRSILENEEGSETGQQRVHHLFRHQHPL